MSTLKMKAQRAAHELSDASKALLRALEDLDDALSLTKVQSQIDRIALAKRQIVSEQGSIVQTATLISPLTQ